MIIYKKGNLLLASEKIIAHGCNSYGKMGSGVAKQIKLFFPEAFKIYNKMYKLNMLKVGTIVWAESKDKRIANCITQQYYGRQDKQYVSYAGIRSCMYELNYQANGANIAMPKIGAGLGGGDWKIIEKIIEEEIVTSKVIVYEL